MAKLEYNSKNQLEIDGQSLSELFWQVSPEGKPAYLYSSQSLKSRLDLFTQKTNQALGKRADSHYALKANSHLGILKIMVERGFGADVVSGGELQIALRAGFPAQTIVFSGAGKTKAEIDLAIENQIGQINVESPSELRRIIDRTGLLQKEINVVLRVNPEVNAITHPYISTGFRDHKFGIDNSLISECLQILRGQDRVQLKGISAHIGSQLKDFSALSEALQKMKIQYEQIKAQGFSLDRMDIGGGVGIHYESDESTDFEILDKYTEVLKAELQNFPAHIQMEPGRFLVARSGFLCTQVEYIKRTPHKTFVIVNSGMNHLLRPALYDAFHRIFPLEKRQGLSEKVDVVGPVCESSDFFARGRSLPPLHEGDVLAVADSGAYGMSMVSLYNAFELPLEKLF
ncbi:MAG: diaminopimelate decarboxylase [Pseudobdellovibrionaceae bacterium]